MGIAILSAAESSVGIAAGVTFIVCPHYASGCQCPRNDEGALVAPHPEYTYGPPPAGEDGQPIEAADTWYARHAREALLLVEAAQQPAPEPTPAADVAGLVGLTL